jgi:uncharacterized zinc-type alcohol dehydrogenase-like protein
MTRFPFVGGHEAFGVIDRIGTQVTTFQLGQRVGVGAVSGFCRDCRWCRKGDDSMCKTPELTVIGRHGGFARKVRAKACAVAPIPDGVGDDLVGPLLCGGNTVFKPILEYVRPEHKVGVIGIGGLGSMAVQFLKHWGCHVTAFTSSPAKRQSALALGAHDTISSVDEEELKLAEDRFDVIISTVNVKLNWTRIISTLTRRGRLHLVGAVLEPLDIGVFSLLGGQKCVSSSPVGSNEQLRAMLSFADRHRIEPQIKVFPFDQINEAFEELRRQPQGRVVLKW